MHIILDTDRKTITVPWNYTSKLEEINRIIRDGGGNKQYTLQTYLEEAWKACMDDTEQHLKVADKPLANSNHGHAKNHPGGNHCNAAAISPIWNLCRCGG